MAVQDLYAAVWEKTQGPAWQARHRMTAANYQATFDQLVKQGYHLTVVTGYAPANEDLYAAEWVAGPAPAWEARHRMSANDYQATFDTLTKAGFRLRTVSGYAVNNQDLYAALWDKAPSPPWQARHRMTAAQYQTTFDELTKQGYRLAWVNTYTKSS